MDFTSIDSLWSFAVHGIDFEGVPYDTIHALHRAVENLATNFSTGSKSSFDTTWPCAICGGCGHTFPNCLSMMDNTKIKVAYIRLQVALNQLISLINKINHHNANVGLFSILNLSSLERLSALQRSWTGSSSSLRTLPPSTSPSMEDLLVSAIQGMQTELSKLNSLHIKLSKFNSIVSNLSAVQTSSSAADGGDDDDTNSTTHTDDSLVAYLNAGQCSDFYLGRG